MVQNKIQILDVDDDVNKEVSFKTDFRKQDDICITESAEEGKLILKQRHIRTIYNYEFV